MTLTPERYMASLVMMGDLARYMSGWVLIRMAEPDGGKIVEKYLWMDTGWRPQRIVQLTL